MPSARLTGALAAGAVALVAMVPFVRGFVRGQAFYFRDLGTHFFPLRLFALEGLRLGELRYWNPYLHEGIPAAFPPVSYLVDLLQVLRPDEVGLSRVLALHVPLAALGFVHLARSRGLSPLAAAAGALAYALGGFCLSTLNLYLYLQAMAWAPLVVWSLARCARGGSRGMALAGVMVAVAASTFGVEVMAQAVLFGAVLGFQPTRAVLYRLGGAVALGLGLAAPSLLPLAALAASGQRGDGFAASVVLAHSIHPLTWMQVIVAGWHGDLADVANRWWGSNFFPRGFPYVLSLYLGAGVLALAAVGARRDTPGRARIVVLALVATFVCLGQFAALESVVRAIPLLGAFRYPVKAFFTVHLALALLAAHGAAALERADGDAWRLFARVSLGAGALLVSLTLWPAVAPNATSWFLAGFTPPEYSWAERDAVWRSVARDAALGGVAALAAGALAVLARRNALPPARACLAVTAVVAADLLRAGAGLNPQVEPGFFAPSPELAAALPYLRAAGRVFTCDPRHSPSYWQARRARPGTHEVWTFATYRETLTPEANVPFAVRTAYSEDFTALVPPALVPREGESCADFAALEERLRRAGVAWVVSLDPLASGALEPRATWQPARLAPLTVHVYALRDPLPLREVVPRGGGAAWASGDVGRVVSASETAGALDLVVEAAEPALLIVRDGYFRGWTARVNGAPAPVERAEEIHRAVPIDAGRSEVRLRYEPSGLRAGVALFVAAVAAALWLCRPQRRQATV